MNGVEGIFEPPIHADGFEAGFAVARLRQVEIGFRFELLLKTKDRIGFVSQSCFWVRPGGPSGRARIGCSDFKDRGSGCVERRSTRCKRSTAATGIRLTDCPLGFVFSVDEGGRDASPAIGFARDLLSRVN